MRPALVVGLPLIHEAEVSFVNERRGLQRNTYPLIAQVVAGYSSEFGVDNLPIYAAIARVYGRSAGWHAETKPRSTDLCPLSHPELFGHTRELSTTEVTHPKLNLR